MRLIQRFVIYTLRHLNHGCSIAWNVFYCFFFGNRNTSRILFRIQNILYSIFSLVWFLAVDKRQLVFIDIIG